MKETEIIRTIVLFLYQSKNNYEDKNIKLFSSSFSLLKDKKDFKENIQFLRKFYGVSPSSFNKDLNKLRNLTKKIRKTERQKGEQLKNNNLDPSSKEFHEKWLHVLEKDSQYQKFKTQEQPIWERVKSTVIKMPDEKILDLIRRFGLWGGSLALRFYILTNAFLPALIKKDRVRAHLGSNDLGEPEVIIHLSPSVSKEEFTDFWKVVKTLQKDLQGGELKHKRLSRIPALDSFLIKHKNLKPKYIIMLPEFENIEERYKTEAKKIDRNKKFDKKDPFSIQAITKRRSRLKRKLS